MNECLLNEFHPHLIICSKGLPEKQKLTDCSTVVVGKCLTSFLKPHKRGNTTEEDLTDNAKRALQGKTKWKAN